jgi:hypothetical protein
MLSRRDMLVRCANGFGAVALASLLSEEARAGTHHLATARGVIFLYMDGGPSQVDTFDPKPLLDGYAGRDPHSVLKVEPTQFDDVGKVMPSPWKFEQHGQSGIPVSELFPYLAKCVDDLTVVRTMVSKFPEHTSANYFLHTGAGVPGRPSMGAWLSYGLGSTSKDLPAFVVQNGGLTPPGGADNFGSGFLPAAAQGSIFRPSDPQSLLRLHRQDGGGQCGLAVVDVADGADVDVYLLHDTNSPVAPSNRTRAWPFAQSL